MEKKYLIKGLVIGLVILIIAPSCIPKKRLLYIQKQKEGKEIDEYVNIRPEKTIQPFDNIYIQVSSTDEKTANIFGIQGRASSPTDMNLIGYTVNQEGFIVFPFVGEINVQGLRLEEARQKIEAEVGQYLTNISITVKFINNTVAVLGEVHHPGEFSFYRDQITIFQALSLAGDFSDYGDKKNVILIRETKNKISYNYIDLTNKDIVSSEYYYIIPNDVIIVKPINSKFHTMSLTNITLILSTMTTLVSLFVIIYTLNLL